MGRQRAAGSGGNRSGRRSNFGSVRKLPSGRFQARYVGPDGREHKGPVTFTTKSRADGWLATRRAEIERETWIPESERTTTTTPTTVGTYAASWLRRRELKPRTRDHYQKMLDRFILPTFSDRPIVELTAAEVAEWYHQLDTGPTY